MKKIVLCIMLTTAVFSNIIGCASTNNQKAISVWSDLPCGTIAIAKNSLTSEEFLDLFKDFKIDGDFFLKYKMDCNYVNRGEDSYQIYYALEKLVGGDELMILQIYKNGHLVFHSNKKTCI